VRAPSRGFPLTAPVFAGLFAVALVAFWPSYLSPVFSGQTVDIYTHVHAALMTTWMMLLIGQATLVRSRRSARHRSVGRIAFVLVPLIVVEATLLAHHRLKGALVAPAPGPPFSQALPDDRAILFYVQFGTPLLFALGCGLALVYRNAPAIHSRLMIAGSLTIIDPVLARIAAFYAPWAIPAIDHTVLGVTLPALLGLAWRDRRGARGGAERRVFPAAIAMFALYQAGFYLLPLTPAWRDFALWFAGLPLS
jgi:hypothetical protein